MKAEYDFAKMKSRKNPYASKLKKSVTIRLGADVIEYFKEMAEGTGIPYQSHINLYLTDCVAQHREIDLRWQKKSPDNAAKPSAPRTRPLSIACLISKSFAFVARSVASS